MRLLTIHFLLVLSSVYPYKNRSPHSVIQPQFAPLYRASSPLITVPKSLPWQMNNTFILLILSPYISSKPCKYWLSSIHTRLFEIIFYLQGGERNMILLVYHVVSTSNISFFYFSSLSFYIALSVSTNRSNLS